MLLNTPQLQAKIGHVVNGVLTVVWPMTDHSEQPFSYFSESLPSPRHWPSSSSDLFDSLLPKLGLLNEQGGKWKCALHPLLGYVWQYPRSVLSIIFSPACKHWHSLLTLSFSPCTWGPHAVPLFAFSHYTPLFPWFCDLANGLCDDRHTNPLPSIQAKIDALFLHRAHQIR